MTQRGISIIANGLEVEVPAGTVIHELIDILGEEIRPDMIVEVNHRFVHLKDYAATPLNEGDRVEVVYLEMGG